MVAVATLVALGVIDLQLRNAVSLQGVVSFELCAYSGSCRAIVEAWGPMGQIWAGLSLGLDYLFMPAYAAAIFFALRLAAERVPERFRRATRVVAWTAWGAAVMDAFENLALVRMLVSADADAQAWPAAICATVKFGLLAVALGWLVVARFARRGRIEWSTR